MENRLVAVAAAVLVAGVAGCATQPPALGGTTARVTINGQSTGGPHAVRCSQTGWSWIIETPDKAKGFTAVVDTGDTVTAQSVDFRDFGGFTGGYWKGNIGEAEVSSSGGNYTINGSADGSFTDNPSNAVTATFRIEADC
jgi:ipoprotein LpqH